MHRHDMPFGAAVADTATHFRLFAPACPKVRIRLDGRAESLPMRASLDGWHELVTTAQAGTRYRFELPDGQHVPDPASRYQPDDVHGPSLVVDPSAFGWTDADWHGRPWVEMVVYELHLGTFTPAGTFAGAIEKLHHLAALGVTAIEIMPVADFAGRRGWGYDGVLLYAPDSSYGRPDDFRRLVDEAHRCGISVMLDVVYNHYGPEGNYLSLYAPSFFTDRHQTPWGRAINYDDMHSDVVRDFAIHNALYWIEEFHLDGLRLDAVHAIVDDSPKGLIAELADRVRALELGRPVHIIVENEDNHAAHLTRDPSHPGRVTAQWNDDVHHVLHTAATREGSGYYGEYLGDTTKLGRALAEGFAFQGETMHYRGSPRGEPSAGLPPDAFVAFVQNHDQIGNRAFGDRLSTSVSPEVMRAVAAVVLLLPQIPMLFMGEEWGTTRPFQFFCDFEGDLADAVRKGRREEFKHFPQFADPETRSSIPDPLAESTFLACKLNWSERDLPHHRAVLDWHTRILAARRRHVIPLIGRMGAHAGSYREIGPSAVSVVWRTAAGPALRLEVNLKHDRQSGFAEAAGDVIWLEGRVEGTTFEPWTTRWTVLNP